MLYEVITAAAIYTARANLEPVVVEGEGTQENWDLGRPPVGPARPFGWRGPRRAGIVPAPPGGCSPAGTGASGLTTSTALSIAPDNNSEFSAESSLTYCSCLPFLTLYSGGCAI